MTAEARTQRWKLAVGSLVIALGTSPIAFLLAYQSGAQGREFWGIFVAIIAAVIVTIQVGVRVIPSVVGRGLLSFLAPSNIEGTRAIPFSHAEAMAVRGDHVAAAEEFERLLQVAPDDIPLHRGAAEFFVRSDPARAVVVLQRLRQLPKAKATDEHYATHRLIDLYAGPCKNPGRMRVELRRLIERFPGTPDAEGAEVALERLRIEAGTAGDREHC